MEPWNDWVPGVLNKVQVKQLCEEGLITVESPIDSALDESSMDLSLASDAFRMVRGSVKPSAMRPYGWFLKKKELAEKQDPNADGVYTLRARNTYVFKLRERLERKLAGIGIHGQATAKSTVGRVDVLVRLIVDGMDTYECFDPTGLATQSGDMYLEITPITFSVAVKQGTRLSQLRLFYGHPKSAEMSGEQLINTIFHGSDKRDGSLTVSLENTIIGGLRTAAFCAKSSESQSVIPLWVGERKPEPQMHWRFSESDPTNRLEIQAENFYILRSKETISVPKGIAIYCRASDETIGEMRIHYAGFVHPLFGLRRKDGKKGTPLIFEVRGHQVNVSLADGERMANLTFYRMSQDAIGDSDPTEYEDQTLQLSKLFDKWPEKLKRISADGTVEAV
ncbi:MAG: 2'-deoxycytidine 5'-triphosphate deaminase [Terriglobales bacterium]|jgi:dCTP deaminase